MSKASRAEEKEAVTVAEPVRLDIGAGQRCQDGFKGVDRWEGADIVADINEPWAFAEDDSVDEIFSSHTIEHVDIIHFMNEAHRVLKPGGRMKIIAPYYSSVRCWQDPTHRNAISEMSFLYYNKEWRTLNGLDHYPITADFDFSYGFAWAPEWQNRSDDARAFALKFYVNVVTDIEVNLVKR